MPEQVKSFIKGLNKDIDYRVTPEEVYVDAHNIRLIDDSSGKSLSVNNIKGMIEDLSIPGTDRIQEITITDLGNTWIEIQSQGGAGYPFDTTGCTYEQLYNFIINLKDGMGNYVFTNCLQCPGSVYSPGDMYNLFYSNSHLILQEVNRTDNININTGGNFSIKDDYVANQDDLTIIGYTTIRDDIYLFTTNCENTDPQNNVSGGSVGQIWKYTYDKVGHEGVLELKYNNHINFTTYYNISPTAALGRYENGGIQRIYWTDFYNKLRTLNVANPQSLAISPSDLDIVPSVNLDIPILTNVSPDGTDTIKVGCYQCAYRLKNSGGAITTFSELSNNVFIGNFPVSGTQRVQFKEYIGQPIGTDTHQRIGWIINNLDKRFDRIEIVVALRETLTGTPIFYLLPDVPISTDSYTVSYDGYTQGLSTQITQNDFLQLSGLFTNCKSIATKDNRLFVANIKNQQQDLNFDCRAYRWTNTPELKLIENGVLSPAISDLTTIVDISDAINPDVDNYKYQSDGTTLGGEGLNVSYEFCTIAVACDADFKNDNKFELGNLEQAPWRCPVTNKTLNDINLEVQEFNDNNVTQNTQLYTNLTNNGSKVTSGLKYQHSNGVLKGFQRNEIYRFGIQFYDKNKNPYFVKWIGDIKMPDYGDTCENASYDDSNHVPSFYDGVKWDFRLSFIDNNLNGYYEAFVNTLGIHFTIQHLETISDKISGYSIVRLKRENSDKTVISTGYMTNIVESNQNTNFYQTTIDGSVAGGADAGGNLTGNNALPAPTLAFYNTVDLADGNLKIPEAGMAFNVKALLSKVNNNIVVGTTGTENSYYFYKMYNFDPNNVDSISISDCIYLDHGITYYDPVLTKYIYNNDFNQDAGDPAGPDHSFSICNPTYYVRLDASLDHTLIDSGTDKFFVTITTNVNNQYGGNTYVARSNNEYIKCAHFRPMRTTTISNFTDNFKCFGGDVFIDMVDNNRWAKNADLWGDNPRPCPDMGLGFSATYFYPCESAINSELRWGEIPTVHDSRRWGYMNKDWDNGGVGEFFEKHGYNGIYSAEDTIKTYFPKPDPFIPNEEFDTRFYTSDIKINGELVDSWGLFKETNVWDVEGVHGPVNAIAVLRDKLYFWQSRAFGIMEVNPRAVVQDVNNTTNSELQLGTGLPLQRHDYISTESGLQHQTGVLNSAYKFFWLDVNNKKLFSFTPGQGIEPLSDLKGMFSYLDENLRLAILDTDKPTFQEGVGVRGIYDYKWNQAIFTVIDNIREGKDPVKFTLVYDDAINAFVTFLDFWPKVYFSNNYTIFSEDPSEVSHIYIHDEGAYGKFYNVIYPATIQFPINSNPLITKVFDNLSFDSQVEDKTGINKNNETWNQIRVYNDYQNTDWQDLTYDSNIKRKERTWNIAIPRNRVLYTGGNSPNIFADLSLSNKPFGERMRDKYILIDLVFNNLKNLHITCNNVVARFRESFR